MRFNSTAGRQARAKASSGRTARVELSSGRTARLAAAAACLLGAGSLLAPAVMASAGGTDAKAAQQQQQPRGKGNASGVQVRPTVPAKIALGETVTVKLEISGVTAADGATVEVRETGTRNPLVSTRVAAGEQRTIEFPYTGRADGMQFIDVTTAQGGRMTVQSLPLRVGSGELKLKPEGQRRTTASGESVISLPAASPGASR
jgi:hypothetical protein